jgi:hypothetical protein
MREFDSKFSISDSGLIDIDAPGDPIDRKFNLSRQPWKFYEVADPTNFMTDAT